MSVDFDWDAHTPVELRRGLGIRHRWNERDHPRDSEGKFTRGQRVKVPGAVLPNGKKRMHTGTIASGQDSEGNYTVRVDNGVNGRRVKHHASNITPTETRNRARLRNGAAIAAVPMMIGANYYLETGRNPIREARAVGRAGVAAGREKIQARKNDKAFRNLMKANGFNPGRRAPGR